MNYIAIQCQNFDYRKFVFRNDGTEISGCESRRNGPGVIPRNGGAQELAHKVSLTTLLDVLSRSIADDLGFSAGVVADIRRYRKLDRYGP